MKLISVQSSERHCVIPQIWSSIHQQRGPLAVFISWHHLDRVSILQLNSPFRLSLLFFLAYTVFHWGQMTTGGWGGALLQSRSFPPYHVSLLWIATHKSLCLSVLATAYRPFMPLQKAAIFWSRRAVEFRSCEVSLSSSSRKLSHFLFIYLFFCGAGAVWLSQRHWLWQRARVIQREVFCKSPSGLLILAFFRASRGSNHRAERVKKLGGSRPVLGS